MNGPEHYREAERLAAAYNESHDVIERYLNSGKAESDTVRHLIAIQQTAMAAAQVHATLAQVAMTFDAAYAQATDDIPNRIEWQEAMK